MLGKQLKTRHAPSRCHPISDSADAPWGIGGSPSVKPYPIRVPPPSPPLFFPSLPRPTSQYVAICARGFGTPVRLLWTKCLPANCHRSRNESKHLCRDSTDFRSLDRQPSHLPLGAGDGLLEADLSNLATQAVSSSAEAMATPGGSMVPRFSGVFVFPQRSSISLFLSLSSSIFLSLPLVPSLSFSFSLETIMSLSGTISGPAIVM